MTKKELQELDLQNITEDLYVKQSEAAKLLAKYRLETRPDKYKEPYTVSRSHIFNLTRHKIHKTRIRIQGGKVNLYDVLHLPVLNPGRPVKSKEILDQDSV